MLVVIKNVHAIRKLHNTGLDISIHVIHFSQLAIQGDVAILNLDMYYINMIAITEKATPR